MRLDFRKARCEPRGPTAIHIRKAFHQNFRNHMAAIILSLRFTDGHHLQPPCAVILRGAIYTFVSNANAWIIEYTCAYHLWANHRRDIQPVGWIARPFGSGPCLPKVAPKWPPITTGVDDGPRRRTWRGLRKEKHIYPSRAQGLIQHTMPMERMRRQLSKEGEREKTRQF